MLVSTAAADGTVVLNCMKTDFMADICAALLATDLTICHYDDTSVLVTKTGNN